MGHRARRPRRRSRRARDAEPRHPPGALAGRQYRRRCAVGAGGRDVRRGPVSRIVHGARVRRPVRTLGRGHDAQTLRRQFRRRRP